MEIAQTFLSPRKRSSLDVINGNRDQLEGRIQERYGYQKDQVKKDIDDWYGRQNWQG